METLQRNNLKPSKGRAFWERHINQWQQSGQSKICYCRTHSLAPSTLDSWRRKLQTPTHGHEPECDFVSLNPHRDNSVSALLSFDP